MLGVSRKGVRVFEETGLHCGQEYNKDCSDHSLRDPVRSPVDKPQPDLSSGGGDHRGILGVICFILLPSSFSLRALYYLIF